MSKPLVLVVGSLNADLVLRTPRIPSPGETLTAGDLQIFAGGKGANQACAAARLGAFTKVAGFVGNDPFAGIVLNELQASGVDLSILHHVSTPTGTATILVLPEGENCILLSSGANAQVGPDIAAEAASALASSDFLLCQLEIPLASVEAAVAAAAKKSATVILDPAPAVHLSQQLLRNIAILTPNQTEAALLAGTGEEPRSLGDGLNMAVRLQSLGPKIVIVKMGALGCVIANGNQTFTQPASRVHVVDSTAAGDTFNGALAVALSELKPLAEAVKFATAAASISVTRPGAIASMPQRSEVDALVNSFA